jgi:NAD(P)-dependent dehydrogenase (short-subunit alcohol dehydrogenase family)
LRAEKRLLERRDSGDPVIDSDSVLLITGGARGITAAVARDLASQYHPTLILAGRSPLPSPTESIETADLVKPKELKRALLDHFRSAGEEVTPARIETRYQQLMREREIRKNLVDIQQAGARVEYKQVDVRDEAAFKRVIEEIYGSYGRLDGVIHGAGVIEDKLMEDKTPESFDRVFDTKVSSAFTLAQTLRPDVKFVVFFSSTAGCFGNRGQADYAAANEVMNKVAVHLDSRFQGRVISINWGPWEGIGMLSEEVRRKLAERGVRTISPDAGARALDEEIRLGRKGEVEIVLGSGPWESSEAIPIKG